MIVSRAEITMKEMVQLIEKLRSDKLLLETEVSSSKSVVE